MDILVEALFGSFPRDTKKAAAYGLRSMNGRMRKLAEAILTKGLAHSNRITKDACAKSLQLMKEGPAPKRPGGFQKKAPARPRRPDIREFRGGNRGPARSQFQPRNTRPGPVAAASFLSQGRWERPGENGGNGLERTSTNCKAERPGGF